MNMDDADGDEVKLALGTMRGYREWNFDIDYRNPGMLKSVTSVMRWDSPQPPPAACEADRIRSNKPRPVHHTAAPPVKDCSCGYYALHKPRFPGACIAVWGTNIQYRLAGVVEASGRIIVGPLGFRAENIRIVALSLATPGMHQATVINKRRMESRMIPFHWRTTPDVIDYQVRWPDGSTTDHLIKIPRFSDGKPLFSMDPLMDEAFLLAEARDHRPDKARDEKVWPYPVEAIQDRFGLPVYLDVDAMLKDYPPIESDLIPKPKPSHEMGNSWATGGFIHGGTYTVVPASMGSHTFYRQAPPVAGTWTWPAT